MRRSMPLLLALLALDGCIVAKRSLAIPNNDQTTVVVLTGVLGPPLNDIARHPWFAVRRAGETQWMTFEVGGGGGPEDDPFRHHGGYEQPILHGMWRGAEADRAADCIEKIAPPIKRYIEAHYILYPGPNSNTFGDRVLRKCKLAASLPATSVGKDWRGLIGAGVSSERTGLQLETPLVGVKIGLKEGIEIHIIGLTFGIDLWPPAILLPLGPGRLGLADR